LCVPKAVELELFGASSEGSLALAGLKAHQPKPFDALRAKFKPLGVQVSAYSSLTCATGYCLGRKTTFTRAQGYASHAF